MAEEKKLDVAAEDLDLDESNNLIIKTLDQDTVAKLREQLSAAKQDAATPSGIKMRVTIGV